MRSALSGAARGQYTLITTSDFLTPVLLLQPTRDNKFENTFINKEVSYKTMFAEVSIIGYQNILKA